MESPDAALTQLESLSNWVKRKTQKRFFIPHWVSIIFLVLLTYAVYQESLNATFLWDDNNLILRDEQIKSLKNIPGFFGLTYWKEEAPFPGANFRPLRTVSFAIDYFLWGDNPYGYHLTNLVFHIFNVLLVYWFVALTLRIHDAGYRIQDTPLSPPLLRGELKGGVVHHASETHSPIHHFIPLLSALLFAAHPIHTEAVVWIKNRSELFSTFFFLSALILFIRSQKSEVRSQESELPFTPFRDESLTGFTCLLSTLCFVFALLSKEVAITLPVILMFYLYFFTPLEKAKGLLTGVTLPESLSLPEKIKKIFLRTLPFWVIGILYTVLRISLLKLWAANPASTLDLSSRILLVIKTVGEYLKLLLFPVNLSAERLLSIPKSILELDVLIYAVAIILLLISGVLLFRRAKPASLLLSFVLFWIFSTILPAGNIYYLYTRPLAEQRLYLPSAGFCILLALLIAKGAELLQRAQKISLPLGVGQLFGVLAAAGILAFYSVGTIRRTADWQDPLRFWEKTAKSNPGYPRAQMNLGLAYMDANRIEEAIQSLEQALSLKSETIYFSLGLAYKMQGKIEEATAMFEKGISLTSSDIGKAYLNPHIRMVMPRIREIDLKNTEFVWGYFYQMIGLKEKAIEYYRKALALNPAHGGTHYNLAQIYENEGQYSQAISHYQQVIKAEPKHQEIDKAYFNLGKIHRLKGEPDQAITYWKKAAEIKPALLELRLNLAELYKEKGMNSEAIEQYKKAVEIVPKNWDVYFNLGLLYTKQGLSKEAAEYYEKAVQCNPNFAEAHYQLGLLYLDFGRFNDAAKLFQRIMYLDPTNMQAKKMYGVALKSAKQGKAVQPFQN